ncbi:hypothetical protein D9M68_649580 [compost metagenome]
MGDLLAQAVGHHLDGFRLHMAFTRKHQLEQALLGDRVPRLAEQGLQHGQLARCQLHGLAGEVHRAAVFFHVHAAPHRPAAGARRAVGVARTAHQRAQTRLQFVEIKRLGQVVVGAGVQADDAVAHGAARGEDDDRRGQAGGARVAQHLQAVAPGQAQVE